MSRSIRVTIPHQTAQAIRRWMRFSATIATVCLLLPIAAHAQSGSPFDTGFTALQTLFTGTVAKVASLIAIVIGGYGFAHGEPGAKNFDHGYAVTSHSSQGLTTDRVLVNMDTAAHPELINTRFAYVSVSRASEDARIYTNNAITLAERLSTDISKASAVEVAKPNSETQARQPQSKEQTMTNTREVTPEEQRWQFQQEARDPATEKVPSPAEIDHRHYAPLHNALQADASGYEWKRETGDIQSYQHNQTGGWLHIDQHSQFYDRHAQPIPKEQALEHAGHLASAVNEVSQAQSIAKGTAGTDQGLNL